MNSMTRTFARLGVGTKLSTISFVLIALVFGAFVWANGHATTDLLERTAADEVNAKSRLLIGMTQDAALIRDRLLSLKVGKTGGYYVLDTQEGADYGKLLIAAQREGQNILADKSADGRAIVKEMLERKEGIVRYRPAGGSVERMAIFTAFPERHWLVVGETDTREFSREATSLRNLSALAALVALLILAALLYAVISKMLARPLQQATQMARQLASGDLTARVETRRHDEIGHLLVAINGIGQGLANVVWHIRRGTDMLASATHEIADGNLDLSSRTEQQASSLEETASAMEEMTSTVKENAANADEANQLARTASQVAIKGGQVVGEVVNTMD